MFILRSYIYIYVYTYILYMLYISSIQYIKWKKIFWVTNWGKRDFKSGQGLQVGAEKWLLLILHNWL